MNKEQFNCDTNHLTPNTTMETLNMTWVNLLRKQYLDILDFYAANKQLLDDKELMKAYQMLLSVTSVEEFKLWRKLLKDYGLSFTDVEGIPQKGNLLGALDDYAEGANDKILSVFIRWKLGFNPSSSRVASRMPSAGRPSGRMPTGFSRSSDGRRDTWRLQQDR